MAHAEDNGGVAPSTVADVTEVITSSVPSGGGLSDGDSLDGSDISSDYGDISTDDEGDSLSSDVDEAETLSPADRAEQERFGADYSGPKLENREASRLLILMAHASTCPCQHRSEEHRETCRSVKWMMLHVRDCPGTTPNFDVCPFPWCRKVKHLLYHLVSCREPGTCDICSPSGLGRNLVQLGAINDHRMQSYRRKLLAKFARPSPQIHSQPKTENSAEKVHAATVQNKEKSDPSSRDAANSETTDANNETSLPDVSHPSHLERKAIANGQTNEDTSTPSSDAVTNAAVKVEPLSDSKVQRSGESLGDTGKIVENVDDDSKNGLDSNSSPTCVQAKNDSGERQSSAIVRVKVEEPAVTGDSPAAECGTLVENTNAEENTSEPLTVQ